MTYKNSQTKEFHEKLESLYVFPNHLTVEPFVCGHFVMCQVYAFTIHGFSPCLLLWTSSSLFGGTRHHCRRVEPTMVWQSSTVVLTPLLAVIDKSEVIPLCSFSAPNGRE